MKHNPKKYLTDMLDASTYLIEYAKGRTIHDYLTDRAFRGSVERELQNVGEALRQLQSQNPEIAARISEYERIIRFRHALVHGYDEISWERVWQTVIDDFPKLKKAIEPLIPTEKQP